MTDLLSLPIIQALGMSLLHFFWQGGIVGLFLFVVLCILQTPQHRYAVACCALLTLAVLPVVTFVNVYEAPQQLFTPSQITDATSGVATPRQENLQPPVPVVQPPITNYILDKSQLTLYLPWLVVAWFIGALVFSIKLLLSFVTLQRFRSKGVKLADQKLQLKLLEFSKRLNVHQTITLLESKLVPVPVVLGWLRPVILLPASAVSGLAPHQLEMLLAHELAHVLRRDYLVNVLQSVLESLLFYHPVVWWVSNQIRREREYCCDDIAVSLTGDAQQYARTLLSLAEVRVSLAPSANGGQLFTRVSRLLKPLETDMKPSYVFAGLSSLGILVALLLTIVNVSVAQEDKAELWVTVVGDVTFSEDYSDIIDTAPDAYVVLKERNGLEEKNVLVTFSQPNTNSINDITFGNGKSFSETFDIVHIDNDRLIGYEHTTDGKTINRNFDESARAWYEQAIKGSIPRFYPRDSKDPTIISAEKYEDEVNDRTIFVVAEPIGFENTFGNLSTAHWETTPTQEELLEVYREDIRYQTQRYGAGLLKDRSFAGYLDGLTASPDFAAELFPDVLEAVSELNDADLRQQLITLIETRSKTPKDGQSPFTYDKSSVDSISMQIEENPSSDGKNRVSGRVLVDGEPASFANVSISIPMDATVDPGLGIAQTGSNKQGEFSFRGFSIPSGDYIISVEQDNIFTNFIPFSIDEQELEIHLDAIQAFNTLEPKLSATVSTTPTLSWETTPNAVRYLVTVYNDSMKEQLVYQMTEATTLALELPLEPKQTYVWTISAYNESGRLINAAYGDVFKTE